MPRAVQASNRIPANARFPSITDCLTVADAPLCSAYRFMGFACPTVSVARQLHSIFGTASSRVLFRLERLSVGAATSWIRIPLGRLGSFQRRSAGGTSKHPSLLVAIHELLTAALSGAAVAELSRVGSTRTQGTSTVRDSATRILFSVHDCGSFRLCGSCAAGVGFAGAEWGGYNLGGYLLGGACRAAIYDVVAPPPPPPVSGGGH